MKTPMLLSLSMNSVHSSGEESAKMKVDSCHFLIGFLLWLFGAYCRLGFWVRGNKSSRTRDFISASWKH